MSQKKFRELRQRYRRIGIDPSEKEYTQEDDRVKKFPTGLFTPSGVQLYSYHYVHGTVSLAKKCGRSWYQSMKRGLKKYV